MTYLHGAVCQMHHDGAHRAEPRVQMGNTGKLIALDVDCPRASLNQMLRHVALEVRQQLHLFLHLRWIVVNIHVRFDAFLVDKVHIAARENRKSFSLVTVVGISM